MTVDVMDRADKLDMLIRRWGGTQGEAAIAAGIVATRLSEWKRREWTMPVEAGVRLARVLGVSVEYLVDDELDDIPAPDLTQDEREVLSLYRALRIEKPDALRALAVAASQPVPVPTYRPIAVRPQHELEAHLDAQAKREQKRAKRKGGEPGPAAGGAPAPGPSGAPHDRQGDGAAVAPTEED